jgi:hypothetical protein
MNLLFKISIAWEFSCFIITICKIIHWLQHIPSSLNSFIFKIITLQLDWTPLVDCVKTLLSIKLHCFGELGGCLLVWNYFNTCLLILNKEFRSYFTIGNLSHTLRCRKRFCSFSESFSTWRRAWSNARTSQPLRVVEIFIRECFWIGWFLHIVISISMLFATSFSFVKSFHWELSWWDLLVGLLDEIIIK